MEYNINFDNLNSLDYTNIFDISYYNICRANPIPNKSKKSVIDTNYKEISININNNNKKNSEEFENSNISSDAETQIIKPTWKNIFNDNELIDNSVIYKDNNVYNISEEHKNFWVVDNPHFEDDEETPDNEILQGKNQIKKHLDKLYSKLCYKL